MGGVNDTCVCGHSRLTARYYWVGTREHDTTRDDNRFLILQQVLALIMDDREGEARCVGAHGQTCPLIQLQQLVGMYSALHVYEMASLSQCILCVLMLGGAVEVMYTEVPLFTLKDLHPRHTEADRLKKKRPASMSSSPEIPKM